MARADRAPERVDSRWTVGPYAFEAVSRHGFPEPEYPPVMYRFTIDGQRVDSEMYLSLDRALVAAVGARHMGPRSAGGPGVGTAADWFCKMIDLDEVEEEQQLKIVEVEIPEAKQCPGSGRGWRRAEGVPGHPECVHCEATPRDLDAPEPAPRGFGYLGVVPPHTWTV